MKSATAIIVVLVLIGGAGLWVWQVHRNHERRCITKMQMLYSAAVSYCLEQDLSPDTTITVEKLAPYLRPDGVTCSSGGSPYPAFRVLNGPTCLYGHQFEPKEKRPLRASSFKVAGLYRAFGFTNLIDTGADRMQ